MRCDSDWLVFSVGSKMAGSSWVYEGDVGGSGEGKEGDEAKGTGLFVSGK